MKRFGRLGFAVKRFALSIPLIFAILVSCFLLLHLAPGDAVDVLAGESGSASPEYVQRLRERFMLDKPLPVQLLAYVKNVATLDLGYSFRREADVAGLIGARIVPTLLLMVSALSIAIFGGVILGMVAAMRPQSWIDRMTSMLSLVFYSTPIFWVGLMLILIFSVSLGWLPTSGFETVEEFNEGWKRVVDVAKHLILPVLSLSLYYLAIFMRLMRASMLEQLNQDYVTTARAKGLTELAILRKHVARNAILPILTMTGIQVANLVGGSVVVETVFGWPGLGQLAFESLFARDLNLLMGIFLISALIVVVANILVDVLYTFLDPRITAH